MGHVYPEERKRESEREMAKSLEAEKRQQTEGSLCLQGEGEIERY